MSSDRNFHIGATLSHLERSTLRRYSAPAVSVAVAALVSIVVTPAFQDRSPLAPFTLAVLFSAWYGGFWPGIVATASSIVIVRLLFVRAVFSVMPFEPGFPLLTSFAVLGIAISVVAATLLSANAKLSKTKARLEAANEALNLEIVGRKRIEEELRKQTEALARSNEDLQRFAFVVSHDLQEPLRTIANYADLLARRTGKLDRNSEEFLAYILDGVSRMRQLIGDVLRVAAVSNSPTDSFVKSDCNALVQIALSQLRAKVEEVHGVVTHDPLPVITTDPAQMVQLLANLIGNALKYCQEQPRVHIRAIRESNQWIFSMSDNGIGIDREYHDAVFGFFKRLHSRDEYPGTGVGLALCKRIVEHHGGRIWVESDGQGKGSTFHFTLPADP